MRGHVRGLLWGIDSKLSVSCLPVAPFWFEQRLLVLWGVNRVTTALSRVRCCCWPLLLLPLLVPVLTGLGINNYCGLLQARLDYCRPETAVDLTIVETTP